MHNFYQDGGEKVNNVDEFIVKKGRNTMFINLLPQSNRLQFVLVLSLIHI